MDFVGGYISELSVSVMIGVVIVTLVTSAIHGATGIAGGFLLAAALAPIIGVKPIVPVVSVSLMISHSARTIMNLPHFDRTAFWSIAIPAFPGIVIGAFIYGYLPAAAIAIALGMVIIASIPVRRWAASKSISADRQALSLAGFMYGTLAGGTVGPGMLLIPFMLGYGLAKEAFVATLAAIALVTNVTRVGIFSSIELLDDNYLALGVLIGLMTIPGNWFGRAILRKMTNRSHALAVDILTALGAMNFFWLAYREIA